MKKYIWINPVVEKMYEQINCSLYDEVLKAGYIKASCDSLVASIQNQFVKEVGLHKGLCLDSRCPEAIKKVKGQDFAEQIHILQVEPILIQMARALYAKYIAGHNDCTLWMICPCTQLAQLGQQLFLDQGLEQVQFITWSDFRKQWVPQLDMAPKLTKSPIPLGFFDQTGLKVKSLGQPETMMDDIRKIAAYDPEIQLIELLYCHGGCHNGDGL